MHTSDTEAARAKVQTRLHILGIITASDGRFVVAADKLVCSCALRYCPRVWVVVAMAPCQAELKEDRVYPPSAQLPLLVCRTHWQFSTIVMMWHCTLPCTASAETLLILSRPHRQRRQLPRRVADINVDGSVWGRRVHG